LLKVWRAGEHVKILLLKTIDLSKLCLQQVGPPLQETVFE